MRFYAVEQLFYILTTIYTFELLLYINTFIGSNFRCPVDMEKARRSRHPVVRPFAGVAITHKYRNYQELIVTRIP